LALLAAGATAATLAASEPLAAAVAPRFLLAAGTRFGFDGAATAAPATAALAATPRFFPVGVGFGAAASRTSTLVPLITARLELVDWMNSRCPAGNFAKLTGLMVTATPAASPSAIRTGAPPTTTGEDPPQRTRSFDPDTFSDLAARTRKRKEALNEAPNTQIAKER
jgi:hypothetical protein